MRGGEAIRNRGVKLCGDEGQLQERAAFLGERGVAFEISAPNANRDGQVPSAPAVIVRYILAEPEDRLMDELALTPGARIDSCTVYSTTWCPDCHRSKAWLARHDVAFEDIDIEKTDGAAEAMLKLADGLRKVPTIDMALSIIEPTDEQLSRVLAL